MTGKDDPPEQAAELRRRAEGTAREGAAQSIETIEALSPEDSQQLLHELRVHQIQLEMQNEELRRMQGELEASRACYFDLYNLAPVGYITLNEQGLILEANLTVAGLLGMSRSALIKQRLTTFILPEDQDIYYGHRKQLFETSEPQVCEIRLLKKDAPPFWARLEATVTQDADDAPVCRTVVSDITNIKQATEALRASQQILEGITNAIPVRVFWKDKNLVYLGCNAVFARDAGYTDPKDVIGKDDNQMVWHDQAELYRGDDRQVIESGCSKHLIEEPQTTPEGKTITLLTSKIPLLNSEGEISGVLGTYLDITERKQAEEALSASEVRYRRLFESAKDGILILDAETGMIIDVNPFLIELLGYSLTEEFLGKEVWNLGTFKDIISNQEKFKELTQKKYVRYEDLPLETSDGRSIEVEFVSNVYLVDHAKIIQCNIRDITERKRAEEVREKLESQLRQSQKMEAVGQLAGGVAHDFNNILQAISGYSQLLLDCLPEQDETHEFAFEIAQGADRAATLTRQLLAFARKQTIAPKALDLNDLVASMLKLLGRLINEDIDLLWKPARSLWPIKIDPGQIDQILANLIVNARDAIQGVGKVTIETGMTEFDEDYCAQHDGFVPGQYIMLAVSDNGSGMDKETLVKIFEPFFTTKPQGQGTGLGLATVYGIVKQNHGFINVYSEPGEGTAFRIYLPRLVDEESLIEETQEAVEMKTGTETILLAEDETPLLLLATRLLEGLGYTVLAADRPSKAIQMAREYSADIHLLMTDVVMPDMSGRDLWREIVALRPDMKCLYTSGYTVDAIAHRGVLDKGVNFLQKPFSTHTLAARIREVLDRS